MTKKQAEVEELIAASPLKTAEGLRPQEIAALALVMAARCGPEEGVTAFSMKDDMRRAGFNDVATGLALTALTRKKLLTTAQVSTNNFNDEPYTVYKLTDNGEFWLLENQDLLELRVEGDSL